MDFITRTSDRFLDSQKKNRLVTNIVLHPTKKELINFTVLQLYVDNKGKTHEIIKFDFSHGYYHVHKFYLGRTNRIVILDKSLSNNLINEAQQNIRENWEYYRNEYLRREIPEELKSLEKPQD